MSWRRRRGVEGAAWARYTQVVEIDGGVEVEWLGVEEAIGRMAMVASWSVGWSRGHVGLGSWRHRLDLSRLRVAAVCSGPLDGGDEQPRGGCGMV